VDSLGDVGDAGAGDELSDFAGASQSHPPSLRSAQRSMTLPSGRSAPKLIAAWLTDASTKWRTDSNFFADGSAFLIRYVGAPPPPDTMYARPSAQPRS
jgi:hypothetical protein